MLAASTAKLAVLQASGIQSSFKTSSNAMNSYLKMEKIGRNLNPIAKEYKPVHQSHERSCTRRGMLAVSSSVYDPVGFLAPVVLLAKIILQELCRRNFG